MAKNFSLFYIQLIFHGKDIFMIWTAGEDQLQKLLEWINQHHDTIKFTWDWSRKNVNYLDVQVINNNGVIETDLYTKPTDKH